MLKFATKTAFDQTITAIAKNSAGVCWYADSAGLALTLTAVGYVLTALPEKGSAFVLLAMAVAVARS